MAKTKEEYFSEMIAAKNADPILSTILTSNSKASFYQSLFWLFSELAGDFDLTFDDFVETIDGIMEEKQVHNDNWWRRISLGFQIGDQLTENASGNLVYSEIDETNQVIKRAAVLTTDSGIVTLKVAQLSATGEPEKLDPVNLSAFTDYIKKKVILYLSICIRKYGYLGTGSIRFFELI